MIQYAVMCTHIHFGMLTVDSETNFDDDDRDILGNFRKKKENNDDNEKY